ncbi:polyadenylate-binding protein-interacting protein 12-like isoform X2 [Humulus lupulus]|uniref:polyadenylate-binding protein-interacting protein 12-like isoform X2 n=1 Tax=Humulus lupulus TaxID=3486 RepID=UPI002B411C80|nr:polyadenylate-binding protein-interacting protein 12-like isoform X2 [Humulus lupulus]
MAVAENAQKFEDNTVVSSVSNGQNDAENPKPRNDSSGVLSVVDPDYQSSDNDQNSPGKFQSQEKAANPAGFSVPTSNQKTQIGQMQNGFETNGVDNQQMVMVNSGGYGIDHSSNGDESYKHDMRDLEDLLSKLNPMAEEFVPPSLAKNSGYPIGAAFGYAGNILMQINNAANVNGFLARKKNGYTQGRRRNYHKLSPAQRDAMIRRTVYVSDIDQQVTEENLAALFLNCGQVVDCRVCGDPNSILRFAFVEFTDEDGARAALNLSGTMLGYYPVRVLPSKTAIAPVNPTFLPRSDDEREMCSRTIYCTNIDKKVTQADVKLFFESLCGEVQRLRLLGDYHHSTRIAFVEFTMAESAIAALNCSGVVLGTLPIRVSPSKTPVRPRAPRPPLH